MYRDLDPRTWPADQSIAKHALVRELFEGSRNPVGDPAEEYPIDAPELVKDVRQMETSKFRADFAVPPVSAPRDQ
jgi:hypothetical protein